MHSSGRGPVVGTCRRAGVGGIVLVAAALALAGAGCGVAPEGESSGAVSRAVEPTGTKVVFRATTFTIAGGLPHGLGFRFADVRFGDADGPPLAGTNYLFDCGLGDGSPSCTSTDAPATFHYPDESGACAQRCVGLNSLSPQANWLRTGTMPVATAPIPIHLSLQLLDFGTFIFPSSSLSFDLTVDPATGAVTPEPRATWDQNIIDLDEECITARLVPGQWKLCWRITVESCTEDVCACSAEVCDGVDNDCDHAIDEVPECGLPWDLVANLSGQASTTDPNGFLSSPRWNWQLGPRAPLTFFPSQVPFTSQPTFENHSGACDLHELPIIGGIFPGGYHINWMDATYRGPIHWDSHSPEICDDDYNVSILPPPAGVPPAGSALSAGITAQNGRWTLSGGGTAFVIQTEFDSDETIDHFDEVPWWRQLHDSVDAGDDGLADLNCIPSKLGTGFSTDYFLTRQLLNDHFAVITGMVGMDTAHDARSELHPVHIFAVRQALVPNPNDDAWSFFFRNWGNEGFCGSDQVGLAPAPGSAATLTVELERPTPEQGVPVDATCSLIPATSPCTTGTTCLKANFATTAGVEVRCGPGENPTVTVPIGDPSSQTFVVGEVHLVWSPTTAASAGPPAQFLDGDDEAEEEGAEAEWTAAMNELSPSEFEFASSLYRGLTPRAPAPTVSLDVVKTTAPLPAPTPPAMVSLPPSTRTALRTRARFLSVCAATHGEIPDFPELCGSAIGGAHECIYGSDSVVVGEGAAVVNPDGSPGPIGNSGAGLTAIGPRARVGVITSVGSVVVGPAATVGGAITTGGTVQRLPFASIAGPILEGQTLALPDVGLDVAFPPELPRPGHRWKRLPMHFGDHRSIHVGLRNPLSLAPGAYGPVEVDPGGVLSLSAGTYFFDELTIDPHGTISVESSDGAVVVYVREDLEARGVFVERGGGSPNLLVGAMGRRVSVVEAPFAGTVIAPNGTIALSSAGGPGYAGAFLGKRVTLGRGAKVSCTP